jgi:hypothetical protein
LVNSLFKAAEPKRKELTYINQRVKSKPDLQQRRLKEKSVLKGSFNKDLLLTLIFLTLFNSF